ASQKGKIGITLPCHGMVPYSNYRADVEAAGRALDFMYGCNVLRYPTFLCFFKVCGSINLWRLPEKCAHPFGEKIAKVTILQKSKL
ncbi:hypothetical protein RJ641_036607, partial [Dillenia turbinata]